MARTKRAKKQHPVVPLMGAKILDKRAEDLKQRIWECKEQNYPFEGMGILADCENKPLPFTPTAVRTDFARTDPAWTLKRYNTWLRDLDAEIGRLEVLAASAKSLYKDTKTSLRAVAVVKLQSKQILAERRLIALRLGAALQQAKSLKALLEYEKSNQETETDAEVDKLFDGYLGSWLRASFMAYVPFRYGTASVNDSDLEAAHSFLRCLNCWVAYNRLLAKHSDYSERGFFVIANGYLKLKPNWERVVEEVFPDSNSEKERAYFKSCLQELVGSCYELPACFSYFARLKQLMSASFKTILNIQRMWIEQSKRVFEVTPAWVSMLGDSLDSDMPFDPLTKLPLHSFAIHFGDTMVTVSVTDELILMLEETEAETHLYIMCIADTLDEMINSLQVTILPPLTDVRNLLCGADGAMLPSMTFLLFNTKECSSLRTNVASTLNLSINGDMLPITQLHSEAVVPNDVWHGFILSDEKYAVPEEDKASYADLGCKYTVSSAVELLGFDEVVETAESSEGGFKPTVLNSIYWSGNSKGSPKEKTEILIKVRNIFGVMYYLSAKNVEIPEGVANEDGVSVSTIGGVSSSSSEEEETDDENDDVKGHRKAHVRRAHWHKYWIGSRKAEKRECVLHFLPPILVGSGELGFSVVNVDADEDYLPEVADEDE